MVDQKMAEKKKKYKIYNSIKTCHDIRINPV